MANDTWFNTTTHPIDLEDGRVVGAGEAVPDDADTSNASFKGSVENGHFRLGNRKASKADVAYAQGRDYLAWHEHDVADLRTAAAERGLPTEGKKAELVDRLETHDRESAEREA